MTCAAPADSTRTAVLAAAASLGGSAMLTQLAFTRELLAAFGGNELVIGIALGGWLLLTGAGTAVGRRAGRLRHPGRALAFGQVLLALLPLAQVIALRLGRDEVFPRGASVGPLPTLVGTCAILLPFCAVSGMTLALACHLLAGDGPRGAGGIYTADSVGGIAGGALFTFVLISRMDHFALLCVPAVANLLVAGWLGARFGPRWLRVAAPAAAAALAAGACLVDVDGWSSGIQEGGRRILLRANSPYGRLVVTAAGNQVTFFENGLPLFSTGSVERVEETVHYAMSQRPAAREVLLLSGGVTGTAREILRYGVRRVTYVELDPLLAAAGKRFAPQALSDPRIELVATDGRRYVRRTPRRFDVVIVAAADPSSWQLNRYYTAEFLGAVKRILVPGGVVSIGLGHYENYVSPELARLLSSERRTLGEVFARVVAIPGGRVFFLASDGPLDPDIAGEVDRHSPPTLFVNRHYLAATLAADRRADLDRAFAEPAEANRDFRPALYAYHLRHWLGQFRLPGATLAGMLALGLALYLRRLTPASGVIFVSGLAASSLELVLLLVFQCYYGSVYRQVGLLVTLFMAGLATGAWLATRGAGRVRVPRRALAALALAAALFGAILPGVLRAIAGAPAGELAIPALGLALGALVGGQFPLAVAAEPGRAAALYTADFVGAALGAILASTLLVPVLGVDAACGLTAGLNALAAALSWKGRPAAWASSTSSA